jgi:polar amino acid transport system substrate-binding protein
MLPATAPPNAVAALAPSGRLRAAINFGNPVLASRDPLTKEPRGISTDLARELGRRLGVPIDFIAFEGAGNVVQARKSDAWDVCFLAIDPVRAAEIAFTAAYAVIEGVYMVAQTSSVLRNAEVDRAGAHIGVIVGSAYDLFLTRELKHAAIVRAADAEAVMDLWISGKLDTVAGVKLQLETDAARIGGLRLLQEPFMAINQAMGTPRGRDAGAKYLSDFVEEMKASGFVADALARNKIVGATVATRESAGGDR